MSLKILWDLPTLDTTKTYTISVYKSTNGEDGDYSTLATGISARNSSGEYIKTYTDGSDDRNAYYYVTYTESGQSEGNPVLAIIYPTIRELRLMRDFKEELPPLMRKALDSHDRQVLASLQQALKAINMMAPVSAHTITTMPAQYEPVVRLGALIFFYSMKYLNIAIRDFNYGVSGISFNIDRGSKINTALQNALNIYNQFAKSVKYIDYPEGIGLGSMAISTPQARTLGFLFGANSGSVL